MPLTTPFLPLTVSAASLSSLSSSHTGEQPDPGFDTDHLQLRSDLEALSAVSEASATTTPPSTAPPATRTTSRRLTFTRFPLLRKGSRELTRVTAAHFRASSVSSHAHSPFLSTGAPRASRTSSASSDLPSAREPSASASLRFASGEEEPGSSTELASLQQAAQASKMHQTSSRLLRMTDDERPYTRVSASVSPTPFSTARQTSLKLPGGRKFNTERLLHVRLASLPTWEPRSLARYY